MYTYLDEHSTDFKITDMDVLLLVQLNAKQNPVSSSNQGVKSIDENSFQYIHPLNTFLMYWKSCAIWLIVENKKLFTLIRCDLLYYT